VFVHEAQRASINRRPLKLKLAKLSVAVLLTGAVASAGSLFTYTGGSGPNYNGMSGVGPGFHTDVPLTINRLGAWTFGEAHNGDSMVYLGDLSGNLIASALVTDLTVKESDGYAYIPITPIVIGPGDYIITARVFGFGDPLLRGEVQEGRYSVNRTPGSEDGVVTGVSGVTFINGSYIWSNTGAPNLAFANLFVVGGGMDVAAGEGSEVPEPSTYGMLVIGGMGLVVSRKLHRRARP
jgi:hypothetical protein